MPRFKSRDFGTSLLFNGTTDTVVIPHNANQLLTTGMTLSAWIKPRGLGENGNGHIIAKTNGAAGQNGFMLRTRSPNQLGFIVNNGTDVTSGTGSITLGVWQHVLATVASNATVTYYINGVATGTPATTGPLSGITTTNNLTIGNRSGATDRTFDGWIDEPIIWNRVLTAQEISDLYFNGDIPTSGLVDGYLFNEGYGTSVIDFSPTANNGTITGATYSGDVPMKSRFLSRNANAAILANGADGAAGNILSIPFSATLNPTAAVTVEIWFRPTALKAGILFDNSTVGTTNSYFLSMGADGSMNWFSTIGGLSKNIVGTAKKAKFFEWNCVSATYNGSAVLIFLNGSQLAETLAASGALGTNSGPLRIGAYYSGGISATFLGNLSQPRVYAAGCTLAEHQDRYYRSITSTALQAGLVLDLNTQLGAGSTVTDLSGLGNHATMGASASWTSDSPFKSRKASVNANMVKNGDFEYAPPFTAATTTANRYIDGTAGGSTTNNLFGGWSLQTIATAVSAQFDTSVFHSRTASMKLSTTNASGSVAVFSCLNSGGAVTATNSAEFFNLSPNTTYTLSGYVKTSNTLAARIRITELTQAQGIGTTTSATSVVGTNDWTFCSVTFTTAATARFGLIRLANDTAGNISDAWFDDISLTPVYPEGRVPANGNLVKNFDFEVAPTFVAAATTQARWIDGTAGGSTTNATYKWALFSLTGTGSAQFDSSVSFGGAYSMRVSTLATASLAEVCNYPASTAANAVTFGIPVLPSTSYTYSFRMKTSAVSGSAATGAQFQIIQRDSINSSLGTVNVANVVTTQDWTVYTNTFTTSATTGFIQLRMRVVGNDGAGTLIMDAWFDDIYLAPTTNPGRIAIT